MFFTGFLNVLVSLEKVGVAHLPRVLGQAEGINIAVLVWGAYAPVFLLKTTHAALLPTHHSDSPVGVTPPSSSMKARR